jgi:hypothetical protein
MRFVCLALLLWQESEIKCEARFMRARATHRANITDKLLQDNGTAPGLSIIIMLIAFMTEGLG